MTVSLRVGIWCAVSTEKQAEKVSLDDQERQGREWAASIGGEVVAVYRTAHTRDIIFYQDAESQMESYRQLREDIEAGRLDVLWCWDEDRLGRDPALGSQVFSLVEKNGAEVYVSTSPHVIGSKGTGHRYLHAIKQVRAGEDSANRVYRYRMGMRGRIKRGLHAGRLPLGYSAIRNDQGEMMGAEFNDAIGAVDLITTMYLAGRSYRLIAEALNASPWRPPRGGARWHFSSIKVIIENDTYAGIISHGELTAPSDTMPARWDEATHAVIVRERLRRRRVGGYHHPRSSSLRGVAICKRCLRPMTSMAPETLRCATHVAGQACHPNHVKEGIVLEAVMGYIQDFVPGEMVEELQVQDQAAGLRREREMFEAQAEDLRVQRRRIGLDRAAGKMTADIYYDTDFELLAQQDAATVRAVMIDQILAMLPDTSAVVMGIQELKQRLGQLREEAEKDPVSLSTDLQNAHIAAWVERPRYRHHAVIIEVGLNI